MKNKFSVKGSLVRAICAMVGIAINVLFSFLMNQFDIPLYLDTIGTVIVSAFGGFFPGIMVAVFTNVISVIFNADAPYFVSVNVAVAVFTAWYVGKHAFKKAKSIVIYILAVSAVSGTLSTLIQWGLFDGPQHEVVGLTVNAVYDATNIPKVLIFWIFSMFLNLIDKGLATILALVVIYFVPKQIRESILNSGWMQKPLSDEERARINRWGKDAKHKVRNRITIVIMAISVALIAIVGGIGALLYFNYSSEIRLNEAIKNTELVAELLDEKDVDSFFMAEDYPVEYEDVTQLLTEVHEATIYVESLYIVDAKADGLYVICNSTTQDTKHRAGDTIPYTGGLLEQQENFLAGESVEPTVSEDVVTVYRTVEDSNGIHTYYVAAGVSMRSMATFLREFTVKELLILAGFFVMALFCGMWMTGFYIVYPINSIATAIDEFIVSESDQEELDERVRELRRLDIRTNDEVEKMYNSICTMAAGMAEQLREIRHFATSTAQMQNGLIITMADMVENRDSDTGAHIQKTAAYVRIILNGLKEKGYYAEKLTPKYMEDVEMSAPLHDVGKITIPDAVLNKPGKLTDEEYEIMKTHTTAGKNIMEKAISSVRGESYLKEARNMAAYHHERWDGKGYPEGLHGEVIPLSARIMAVADVFDALTSPRVYKPAFSFEKALEIIREGNGTQFDPKCVEVFMESLDEVQVILKKYQGM